MPVFCKHAVRPLSQREFGDIAYEVMAHVFAVHRELGRLFDEEIYQMEIANRLANAVLEVPIEVTFCDFRKLYYLDLLVDGGAIFELKTVDSLVPRHTAQLLNYLLLTDSMHGKLVNLRPENVVHEFVNTTIRRPDRVSFFIDDDNWQETGTARLKDLLISLFRDWGVGLDLSLYEAAIEHFFNPQDLLIKPQFCGAGGRLIGMQDVPQIAPDTAIRVTAVSKENSPAFEHHLRRFFRHTSLRVLPWVNLTREVVQFKTII